MRGLHMLRRALCSVLAMMACAFLPATAGAIVFTSDATITNHDYGSEQVVVIGPAHVTFDNVTFGQFNATSSTYEGRLSVIRGGVATVKNSKFGPGGCSDGIQASGGGGAAGVAIVSNTEFVGIVQGNCGAHVDPIQMYGGKLTLTDSYLHGNSTGVMTPDGNGSPFTITNTVFVGNGEYPWAIIDGGGHGDTMRHNVVLRQSIEVGQSNAGANSSNETVTDNVAGVDILSPQPSSGVIQNHNITNATFVGGTGRCQYALAAGSAGKAAASDGTDIGLNDCSAPPPPPPDRDGDGVPDATDKCPDQPGTMPDGCPVTPPPPPGCDQACEDQYKAQISALTGQVADLKSQVATQTKRADDAEATAAARLDKLQRIRAILDE